MKGLYILQSNRDGRYYIGSTIDFDRRLAEHNSGKVYSTKNGTPWEVRLFINFDDIALARNCEYRLKKYKRRDIVEKVISDGRLPWEYN